MARDLREMFKEHREKEANLPAMKKGHEDRFSELLNQQLPRKKKYWLPKMAIAASIGILLSAGIYFFNRTPEMTDTTPTVVVTEDKEEIPANTLSLGNLSPDLKKVEDYYVTNINLVLSKLEVSADNKGMIDGFMEQLAELDREYEKLNTELNTLGPNDQTINALIKNLQLRLQLLQKLKTELNELKTSKNEQLETSII